MAHRISAVVSIRLIAVAVLLAPAVARGERFLLESGGVVEGTLINTQQTPRTSYEIRTRHGVLMVLPAAQVIEVSRPPEALGEYARLAPTFPDTVDDQWRLAEWCRQHQLLGQRAAHLRRIIELSPDHVAARHALGYVQLQGEWTTRSDFLTERGYRLYKGEWRLPQDIELIEERREAQQLAKEWLARLKQWRGHLNDPKLAAAAHQRIAEVRAPVAVGPLREMLRRDGWRDAKVLYIEVLAEIGTAEAIEALVDVSLNDGDIEVFHACADALLRLQPPHLQKPYLKALRNENNVRINRAAYMLGRIGHEGAVGPLIDVLVTTHQVVVGPIGRGAGDATSATFSANGGNSFQGGDSTKVYYHTVQNREVLDALTRLAGGQTFGYDLPAWKRWHAAERARGGQIDLR
jgi:hypothetical protein